MDTPILFAGAAKPNFVKMEKFLSTEIWQNHSTVKDGGKMTQSSNSNWFVAQLRPHGLRRAEEHLLRQGFESFAPKILANTNSTGASQATCKPLFPGYLFVSFDPQNPRWGAINSTRGISRLILSDPRQPRPLPDALMAGLIARCDASGLLAPDAGLGIGDRIRVLAGPFADLVTTIETLPSSERIGVLIDLMGREVRTSLPRNLVEKLD